MDAPPSSSHPGPSSAASTTPPNPPAPAAAVETPKVKGKEACVACRTTKVKCKLLTPESDPLSVCARCTRLKIPCQYAQAKRGRKAGSSTKRSLPEPSESKPQPPSTTSNATSSASSSNSFHPDLVPNKVQRRSTSHESPRIDYPPPAPLQPLPPPQPALPPSEREGVFPFHSFDQPHRHASSFFPQGPFGHAREVSTSSSAASGQGPSSTRRESSNGSNGSVFPSLQYGHGSETSQSTPHRYLPSAVIPFPSPFENQSNSSHNPHVPAPASYYPAFPPPFPPSSNPNQHQRRPSETQFHSHQTTSPRPPQPSYINSNQLVQQYAPYHPPSHRLSLDSSSTTTSTHPPPPPNSSNSPSTSARPSAQQHQESFLRGPPTPSAPPFDHPSSASTNLSEVSRTSSSSASTRIPSMLSIRGLLSDVVDEKVVEPELGTAAPTLSLAEVMERKALIDTEGRIVRTGGTEDQVGTGLDSRVKREEGGKAGWEDPLSLGWVNEKEVEELFDYFHTRLNVFIDILDVALHTPTYTRSNSSILFTAVLCVASKIAKPELYPKLLKLSNRHLGRAFEEGVCEIGLVQSISILSFWKETTEKGSWRRVGYGIRLAFELELHREHKRPLPDDEIEARKVLDRERTWFQLLCFDHTLTDQHGRPPMISREFRWDVEHWAADHPNQPCLSDAMLAGSLSLIKTFDVAEKIRSSHDDSTRIMLMGMLRNDFAKWRRRWAGDQTPVNVHPSCKVMLAFYDRLLGHDLNLLQYSVVSSLPSSNNDRRVSTGSGFETSSPGSEQVVAFSNCIGSALSVLKFLISDLPQFLVYSQDSVTFGTATAAVWLVKNIARMPPLAADTVYDVLRQATVVCRSVTTDPKDASAYQSRFFQSLIHVAVASRPQSRSSVPNSPHHIQPPVPRHSISVDSGGGVHGGGFDVFQANGDGGVDLLALDEQIEGGGGAGWPFPVDLGGDQNMSLDELFQDLSAWFPSSHGESLVVTSGMGWGVGSSTPGLGGGSMDWAGGGATFGEV